MTLFDKKHALVDFNSYLKSIHEQFMVFVDDLVDEEKISEKKRDFDFDKSKRLRKNRDFEFLLQNLRSKLGELKKRGEECSNWEEILSE
jgi:hypothetical protein